MARLVRGILGLGTLMGVWVIRMPDKVPFPLFLMGAYGTGRVFFVPSLMWLWLTLWGNIVGRVVEQ